MRLYAADNAQNSAKTEEFCDYMMETKGCSFG
jgi:hypothetical protein